MSRTSFDRDDPMGAANAAKGHPEQVIFDDVGENHLYIERDTLLESDLLETSIEDYDDLLSMAQDDYLEE